MAIAINEFNVSPSVMALYNQTVQEQLDSHIALLLTLLPSGTQVIQVVQKAIFNLSMDFTIYLEHPLFDAIPNSVGPVTKIECDYRREFWQSNANEINQQSLFVAIRYLTDDGNKRFAL